MRPEEDRSEDEAGRYLKLGDREAPLLHHPTDFSVMRQPGAAPVSDKLPDGTNISRLTIRMARVTADNPEHRERLMGGVRGLGPEYVAHHIYTNAETKEELVIANRIYLNLRDGHEDKLESIKEQFGLDEIKTIGKTHVLQLRNESPGNPIKVANLIALEKEAVACCSPKTMPAVVKCGAPAIVSPNLDSLAGSHKLFNRQWHLAPNDSVPGAHINIKEAWKKSFGNPEVTIAVIDDGFDIPIVPGGPCHPVFKGKEIHKDARDLTSDQGGPPNSRGHDFHGTPVASIATAGSSGNRMMGVAPDCGFLPLRIALDAVLDLELVLDALQIANRSADVVNCSFNIVPTSMNLIADNCWFFDSVVEMTKTGGRRGKGLVIVFAAGNFDAPTHMSADENKNGIRFSVGPVEQPPLPDGIEIHSGFPEIPGVVVVSAVTSLMRKAAYSNWGREITIAAPSNNFHKRELRPGFGLVAAVNVLGLGEDRGDSGGDLFGPLEPTRDFDDADCYTDSFGGTSGAAPIVTGVIALMLSVNDQLTAADVIKILQKTADADGLLTDLDLQPDLNLNDFRGEFVADAPGGGRKGHSVFFGAGKVNAGEAVAKAASAPPAPPAPPTIPEASAESESGNGN